MSKLYYPVTANDNSTGDHHARIQLVEYGDYQCPHCRVAYPLLKKIKAEYFNEIFFVFRNFPLQSMHPYAMVAALATEAAAKQGKFWEMHDIIFENQEDLSDKLLVSFANELKLDMRRFENAIDSKALVQKVEADFEGGIRSGVNGTPSFFVNGTKWEGYDGTYASFLTLL